MTSEGAKIKEFMDSVHGYIPVPVVYCEKFIDSAPFQRLRYIEQTSMRSLYPSAHHDRFSHSLGVYHLGGIAFHYLIKNSKSFSEQLSKYKSSFLTACLLHDCAHAPFSHTFEKYYPKTKGSRPLIPRLKMLMKDDTTFEKDFDGCGAKEHEIASAILVIECYSDKIKSDEVRGNVALIVRMILGCTHQQHLDQEKRLENCLISILNGSIIDVDRLDYIMRDTWASGFGNVKIDIKRLLSAIEITTRNELPILAFKKSALSVIQSVYLGRNYLYQWIFSHHKVVYDQYLLDISVRKTSEKIGEQIGFPTEYNRFSEEDQKDLKERFFLEAFIDIDRIKSKEMIGSYSSYLPVDGDLLYLVKSRVDEISEAKEWLSREHELKPLWKTFAEYQHLFRDVEKLENVRAHAKERLQDHFQKKGWDIKVLKLDATPKLSYPTSNSVIIDIDGELLDYKKTVGEIKLPDLKDFFYIYLSKKLTREEKSAAITAMS